MKLSVLAAPLILVATSPLLFGTSAEGKLTTRRIDIVAKRFAFTPAEITIKKGVPVTLVLTSQDVDHGLKFRELNISVNSKVGQTGEITFTPDTLGTFVGQCSVFCGSGHGSMKMTIHVVE